MSGPLTFAPSLPPHIRSSDSVTKRFWFKSAALLPALIAVGILGKLDSLGTILLSVMSSMGFEWLSAGFFRKKAKLENGEAFLSGTLLALLMPEHCPALLVVLGNFISAIIIKEIFGGLGSRLFNAPIFARLFLGLGFPGIMTEPVIFISAGEPWVFGCVLFSAFLYLAQKQIYLETPLLFAGIFAAGWSVNQGGGNLLAIFGISAFLAAFYLTDSETLPLTRKGTNVTAVWAALFAVFLTLKTSAMHAAMASIVTLNGLKPWLDMWLLPKPAKVKR